MRRMQRLFSIFPRGGPGVAILLLRIALAAALFHGALMRPDYLMPSWVLPVCVTIGIFVCLGLMTPLAAAASLALGLASWFVTGERIEVLHLCAILDAIVLCLLGPGGYSLDARLFGRQQVVLRPRSRSDGT